MIKTLIGTDVEYAAELLCNGEVVAIPTETVYGLAGNALNPDSVQKIYNLKNRPADNPLIIHVADIEQVYKYTNDVPEQALKLLEEFSPGPLTVLFPKKDIIPGIVTAGQDTVAIRIPKHTLTQVLLDITGLPLAAPSANPFTYISPTASEHVHKMFDGKIRYILEGGACDAGIESTIIGFPDNKATLYRAGAIDTADIERVLGIKLNRPDKLTRTPGMHKKHYAPFTPVITVDDIDFEIKRNSRLNIGVVTYDSYTTTLPIDNQVLLGTIENMTVAMNKLYATLHDMDARSYDLIIAKRFPAYGLGIAINDRLDRAAVHY